MGLVGVLGAGWRSSCATARLPAAAWGRSTALDGERGAATVPLAGCASLGRRLLDAGSSMIGVATLVQGLGAVNRRWQIATERPWPLRESWPRGCRVSQGV